MHCLISYRVSYEGVTYDFVSLNYPVVFIKSITFWHQYLNAPGQPNLTLRTFSISLKNMKQNIYFKKILFSTCSIVISFEVLFANY